MNIEELITFVTLANTKNFRLTSEQLFCSPSTISARIQTLEQELGEKLFERNNKSVRITDSGSIFYPYAKEMLVLWNKGKENISTGSQFRKHITISAPASIWTSETLSIVQTLMEANRSTAYHLVAYHSIEVLERLANNTIDFGLTLQKSWHPDLECVELRSSSSLFLVASPSISLPTDFLLTPDTIQHVPFCFVKQNKLVDFWFENNYKCNSYYLSAENMPIFIQLLLNGLGIGFLPERCALPYLKSGQLVSYPYMFSDTLPQETIYGVYHKGNLSKIADILQAFNCIKNN
ncbi:MAG: LysR family transcriptional regulator [Oscillibacter sp.]|nr:LysR family transcriptional regulator [Oscillibacter sp.]